MFFDLAEIENGSSLDFDVCIIGAGAAGITLALELEQTSASVCLLEAGGLEFQTQVQDIYQGEVTGIYYPPLDVVRLRYFGGTTNHWSGQSTPLGPNDFERRSWIESSGWPIEYAEFASYLQRAQKICRLGHYGFLWDEWKEQSGVPAFPFEGGGIEPVVFRFPKPVTRFGEIYRQNLEDAKNLTCLLHASVLQLVTNEGESQVTAAKVTGLHGRKVDVRARFFIIATGGIENSRLLLVSGPKGGPGLGNNNDLVGRYFMEHPNFDSGEILLEDSDSTTYLTNPFLSAGGHKIRVDFRLNPERQAELEILNHSAFLLPSWLNRRSSARAAGILTRAWRRLERMLDFEEERESEGVFALRVRLERAPRYGSRVTLSDEVDAFGMPQAKLHLEVGELEERTLQVIQEEFAKELGRSGRGRMRLGFNAIEKNWPAGAGWQNHHCGGTRMSSTPREGVVDRNCRIHGVENVYIAGSSVFPTGGHANPTLNLVTMTLRLSDHIKKELMA